MGVNTETRLGLEAYTHNLRRVIEGFNLAASELVDTRELMKDLKMQETEQKVALVQSGPDINAPENTAFKVTTTSEEESEITIFKWCPHSDIGTMEQVGLEKEFSADQVRFHPITQTAWAIDSESSSCVMIDVETAINVVEQ